MKATIKDGKLNELEVADDVTDEAPAWTLTANNAVGGPTVREISWTELRSAVVGTRWTASGGGSLFSDEQRATLVYRDEQRAALMVETEYNGIGRDQQTAKLIGLRFRD